MVIIIIPMIIWVEKRQMDWLSCMGPYRYTPDPTLVIIIIVIAIIIKIIFIIVSLHPWPHPDHHCFHGFSWVDDVITDPPTLTIIMIFLVGVVKDDIIQQLLSLHPWPDPQWLGWVWGSLILILIIIIIIVVGTTGSTPCDNRIDTMPGSTFITGY